MLPPSSMVTIRSVDKFIEHYNLERSHLGYRLQGRTPARDLRESLGIKELPSLMFHQTEEIKEEPKEAA